MSHKTVDFGIVPAGPASQQPFELRLTTVSKGIQAVTRPNKGENRQPRLCYCLLAICLMGLFLISCASYQRRKPLPPGARRAPVTESQVGPERAASNAMIEKGEVKLEAGEYERAFDLFQEAVNLDPNNGIGFYYLAYVRYKMGEYDQVPDFLAKAEALLSSSKEWMERINSLKQEMNPSGY